MANFFGNDSSNILSGTNGTDYIFGFGGDDQLIGNSGNDWLDGGDGNDNLSGGYGADTLIGGAGNDNYWLTYDNTDTVIENDDEGYDTVYSSFDYQLGDNVEKLIMEGTAVHGFGNALDNSISGNASNNLIWGYGGDDDIFGGLGNDTLFGGAGNDYLDGGAGADTMDGGIGDDVFRVDDVGDVLKEKAGEGLWDWVFATVSYALPANVENLTMLDGAVWGSGNGLDNIIFGNAGNNTLSGGDGLDRLYSGGGTDTMYGGALSDILHGYGGSVTMYGGTDGDNYFVDGNDTVIEYASAGIDSVTSTVSYALTANVEHLTLAESGGAINGTGNELDNTIDGNSAANVLTGNAGNDWLDGQAGADTMIGGIGNDNYKVDNAGDMVTENAGGGIDIVQSSVTHTLAANVENLTLTGAAAINGTGNALGNMIIGNAAANTMAGGLGNDIYGVDNAGDVVVENAGEGFDSVQSSVTHTLAANVENLTLTGAAAINGTGNELHNNIYGNSSSNTLTGGLGNDVYGVDNAGDVVVENAGEGTDTVQSSITYFLNLNLNIEGLTLTGNANIDGVGNASANTMYGNAGNNALVGYGGADQIYGGGGIDTASYTASEAAVTVNLATNFNSGGDAEGDYLQEIENVAGSAFNDHLTGNSGNNQLSGLAGADILSGGLGLDILQGGTEADTFVFAAVNESAVATPDQILDFSTAQGDKIDLSQIDAIMGGNDNAFNYIGGAAFTGSAGQLHFVNGLLEGDVDGNGAADFAIEVNQATLAASDFIL